MSFDEDILDGVITEEELNVIESVLSQENNTSNENSQEDTSNDDEEDNQDEPVNIDELIKKIQKLNTVVSSLNSIKNNSIDLSIIQEEVVYFNRLVRPLLDSFVLTSQGLQGIALTAQALNQINTAKPKQVEASVDLAYCVLKELDYLFSIYKERMECYLKVVDFDQKNVCNLKGPIT